MLGNLVESMKKAAIDAVRNTDPTCIIYGKVIKESPLEIQINQKLILREAQIVLTRNVTDYEIEVTPQQWSTGSADGHSHGISGKKKIMIHNKLKLGEELIMIRQTGGQEYIVLDRMG